jgi:hypothetical protein
MSHMSQWLCSQSLVVHQTIPPSRICTGEQAFQLPEGAITNDEECVAGDPTLMLIECDLGQAVRMNYDQQYVRLSCHHV